MSGGSDPESKSLAAQLQQAPDSFLLGGAGMLVLDIFFTISVFFINLIKFGIQIAILRRNFIILNRAPKLIMLITLRFIVIVLT